jgi:Ca2+-binding RTX toxin-like protein
MATWKGTNGDDVRHGDFGKNLKDKLWGAGGDDQLFGGKSKDHLDGGGGNDQLTGGAGNDRLTGGDKHDTFIFGHNSGHDVVTDFDVKKDVLQIAHGLNGIKKPADVLDHAHQTKAGDVVIDLGHGNKITLKNVSLDDLKHHPNDHFDIS